MYCRFSRFFFLTVYMAVAPLLSSILPFSSAQEQDRVVETEIRELRKALLGDDMARREEAAIRLGKLGPKARAALPELFDAMIDELALLPKNPRGRQSINAAREAI